MKTLTIALSLILNLGLFGCHDKDYSPTSFNETESVTPDRPSDKPTPTFVCGGVSFEDGVTEDSGDVFCTEPPSPTRPTPQVPGPVTTEPPSDGPTFGCRIFLGWRHRGVWRCLLF